MVCQKCGKNEATTFLKTSINGKTTEQHLCNECAHEHGAASPLNIGFNIGDFWGSLFAEPSAQAADTIRCEGCGNTFEEMVRTGKAGCPKCYTTFYDRLLPSIQRIHGRSGHTGKIPEGAGEALLKERELEALRKQLGECIANQQFESCAEIRDKIRELEEAD